MSILPHPGENFAELVSGLEGENSTATSQLEFGQYAEILHLGKKVGAMPQAQLHFVDDADFVREYFELSGVQALCIDFDYDTRDVRGLDADSVLSYVESLSDKQISVLVWIRSETKKVSAEAVRRLKEKGVTVLWEKQSLLRYKIDQLSEKFPDMKREALFEKIGVPASTIYSHLRSDRNHFFTDRTWAHLSHGLGISAEETTRVTNLEVRGFSPEEHRALENQIEEVLLLFEDQSLVHASEVFEVLLTRYPELGNTNQAHLETIVRSTMLKAGIEDARVGLWREAQALGKSLKSVPDVHLVEGLRHRMIGNMFEEVALLDLQVERPDYLPQYALTVKRDSSGAVLHTTDIIDLLSVEPITQGFLRKAYYDAEIERGSTEFHLAAEGVVEVEVDNESNSALLKFLLENGEVYTTHPLNVSVGVESGRSGKWYAYKTRGVPGSDLIYSFDYTTSILDPIFSTVAGSENKPAFEYMLKLREELEESAGMEPERTVIGVEVKKAGSPNVSGIMNQLRRQREAILKVRENDPLSIAAQVGCIKVVVLNSNHKLKKAIQDLNEEIGDNYFRYDEFSSHAELGSTMTSLLHSALENRSLEEAVLLRRFFARLNMEYAAKPTLGTLYEMYMRDKDAITVGGMPQLMQSDSDFIEHAVVSLQHYFKQDEQQQGRNETTQKVRALMRDFNAVIEGMPRVTEEWLHSLFLKHFPGRDFETAPDGVTAMTVYQDYGDNIDCSGRKIERFSRHFLHSARMSRFQLPAELYAAVTRVAGKFAPEVLLDLETIEGAEELILRLQKERQERDVLLQERSEQEANFAVGLVLARLQAEDIYNKKNAYDPDWLGTIECHLITDIKSHISGFASDTDAALKTLAGSQLVSRALVNHMRRDTSEPNDSIYHVLREWTLANTGEEHNLTTHFKAGLKFRRDLATAAKKLWDAASDYQSPMTPRLADFSRDFVSLHTEFASTQAAQFKTLPRGFYESVPIYEASTEYSMRIDAQVDIIMEQLNEIQSESGLSPEESITRLTEECEIIEPEKLNDYSPYLAQYCGDIGAIEELQVYNYLTDTVKKAAILGAVDDDLAREYVLCRIMSLVEFPTRQTDLYMERFLGLTEILKDLPTANAAADYLDSRGLSPGDFIHRTLHMSLSDNDSALIRRVQTEPLLSEYFQYLQQKDFEAATALDVSHRGFLYGPLRRLHAMETRDVHLNWIRAFDMSRVSMLEFEREMTDPDLLFKSLGVLPEIKKAKGLYDQARERSRAVAEELKMYLDEDGEVMTRLISRPKIEAARKELLRFLELSNEAHSRFPDIFSSELSIFDEEKYKGLRQYQGILKAKAFLHRHMPFWGFLYIHAPGPLLKFARYRENVAPPQALQQSLRRKSDIKKQAKTFRQRRKKR